MDKSARLDGGSREEWNFLEFAKAVLFRENLFARLGNLWFLIILFIVTMITYPSIAFCKRRVAGNKLD